MPRRPSYLAFQRLGAADDLHELLGDRGLPGTVHLERETLDHLARVLAGALHCRHARALLARDRLEDRLEYLHLVDLDGAKSGRVVNWKVIIEIQEKTALRVDFGGGVHSTEEVGQLLDLGIDRINIGTIAVTEPSKLHGWMQDYGAENFILSADLKGEEVQINGWQKAGTLSVYDLVAQFEPSGLQYLSCTDINTDGTMVGPNFGLYKKLMD